MTKLTQLSVPRDLLNELLCGQYEVITDYKMKIGDRIHCTPWNNEINDLIETYNDGADILGIEKMELINHD